MFSAKRCRSLLAFLLFFSLCFLSRPPPAAAEFQWKPDRIEYGFFLGNRFRGEQNLPDTTDPTAEQTSRFLYQGNIVLSLGLDWSDIGAILIVLDSGELSSDTIHDGTFQNDMTEDAFFQEGYFESFFLDKYGIAFKVGQQHIVAGNSYILDDFLLAGQVGLDMHKILDLPFELFASVARVQGSSLYFQLRATHPFSAHERVSLSLGWLHDTEGLFSDIHEEIVALGPNPLQPRASLRSSGEMLWVVLSAQKMISSFRFSLVGILDVGNISLYRQTVQGRVIETGFPALGYLIDFQVGRNLTERLYLELFYLMASGDDDVEGSVLGGNRLNAFVSIVPFITRTNIFFNGGINDIFSTRSFDTAGGEGRGFGVPGIILTYSFTDRLYAVWKGAYLFATADPPADAAGGEYGWEIDLMGFWEVGKHVRLSVEADLFLPGSFYERVGRPDPETAYRLMGGVDIYF